MIARILAAATQPVDESVNLVFEPANFVENLKYMGTGYLGIFIVTGVIIGVVTLLTKMTSK